MSWIVRVSAKAFGHAAGGCLVAALVLGACGTAEQGVGGAQREQAKKADAICMQAQEVTGRTLGDEAAKEEMAVKSAAERLAALETPSENETIWRRLVAETDNLWLNLLDVAQAQEVNDRPRTQKALDRARATNGQIMRLAEKYGAVECAKGYGR